MTPNITNVILAGIFVHSPTVVEILKNIYEKIHESLGGNENKELSLLILNPYFEISQDRQRPNKVKLTILSRLSRYTLVLKEDKQYLLPTCSSCNKVYGFDIGIIIKGIAEEKKLVEIWKNLVENIEKYIVLEPGCSINPIYSAKAINRLGKARELRSIDLSLQGIICSQLGIKLYKIRRIIIPFVPNSECCKIPEYVYSLDFKLVQNIVRINKVSSVREIYDNYLKKILEAFKNIVESSDQGAVDIRIIKFSHSNGSSEWSIVSLRDVYNDYLDGVKNYCKHIEENYLDPQSVVADSS